VTRGELLIELAATLDARHEARFILDEVHGPPGTRPDQPLSEADTAAARAMADRRRAGEPLQYVLGHWGFRSLDLMVDPRVLIPRPETEQVVEVALEEIGRLGVASPVIVDAGTGSGAIALSMATEVAGARVWAIDISRDALVVAALNLERTERHDAHRPSPQVTFSEGSWLAALPASLRGSVDLVVSNPPYVAEVEWADLPGDVRCEPHGALVAGAATDDTPGLGDVEKVLTQSLHWLSRPGAVVIELAPHQAAAATRMAQGLGYLDVRVAPDLSQRPRALVGRIR
jgi:release factor glutamine methyltransferase